MLFSSHPANDATAKRINERLLRFWESVKTEQQLYPLESAIDIERLEDIWGWCFLVKCIPGTPFAFTYLYLGTNLIKAYNDEAQEKEICEKLAFPSSVPLRHKFDEVLLAKKPVFQDGEFFNTQGLKVMHRSILLPFASDSNPHTISYILGGMRWKFYL